MNKNNKDNKNSKYVHTKSLHFCKYCNGIIPQGSYVHTVNPKRGNRFWICKECNDNLHEIITLSARRNSVSFGDEGGWLAYNDALGESVAKFMERCVDEQMLAKLEAFLR